MLWVILMKDNRLGKKISNKEWISKDSLLEYIRNLEISNEIYRKEAQELFDDLIEKVEE